MKKPVFLKQKNMIRVLYSLVPVALVAVYFFGWRVLALVGISALFCLLTEWIMAPSTASGRVSYAVYVTAALYGLSLPPTTPFWMAAVGAVVAILFGKMVFGGFGKNVFNPAIVGRAFVYVCFPVSLTSSFVPVFRGFPGGFARWSLTAMDQLPEPYARQGLSIADAVTAATPMWARRDYGVMTGIWDLVTGRIGDVFDLAGNPQILAAGSAGEVCGLVIILSGIYLLWTKTANYRLMAGTLIGATALNLILRTFIGLDGVPPLPFTLFSGAMLYATVFMVTDPVSAPKVKLSQWIYGIMIGALIVFFRYKAVFAGGVAFAILIGNMFAPSLDLWIKRYRAKKKEKEEKKKPAEKSEDEPEKKPAGKTADKETDVTDENAKKKAEKAEEKSGEDKEQVEPGAEVKAEKEKAPKDKESGSQESADEEKQEEAEEKQAEPDDRKEGEA